MDTKNLSYKARIIATQLFIAFCSCIMADFLHDFVDNTQDEAKIKGDINNYNSRALKDAYSMNLKVVIITFVVSMLLSRFVILLIIMSLNVKNYTKSQILGFIIQSIFKPHDTQFLEEITCSVSVCGDNETKENRDSHQELMYSSYKQICALFETTKMRHQVDFLIVDPRSTSFFDYIHKYNSYAEG